MRLARMTICVFVLIRARSIRRIGLAIVRRVAMSILRRLRRLGKIRMGGVRYCKVRSVFILGIISGCTYRQLKET